MIEFGTKDASLEKKDKELASNIVNILAMNLFQILTLILFQNKMTNFFMSYSKTLSDQRDSTLKLKVVSFAFD